MVEASGTDTFAHNSTGEYVSIFEKSDFTLHETPIADVFIENSTPSSLVNQILESYRSSPAQYRAGKQE